MEINIRLKACPFCGWDARIYEMNRCWFIECCNCNAKTKGSISIYHAVELWNKRVKEVESDE